jgi:lipopolysaccharide transport system ATP-binding protein
MSNTVIRVENLSKQYRLGEIGTGSLSQDLKRSWARLRGKEDPFLQVGETNDRTSKGTSEFVWALKDINFEVKQGDVLGIIGRNGAGKSTLLKVLSKTTQPTTGSIKVNGRLASLLEVGTGFHPDLTGRDNIYLNGAILGMTKREIKAKFEEIVDFSGVERYVNTPVKRYSSGMYVRLAFAVAAYLDPEILIVDEVLAVGDLDFQKKAIGKMKSVSLEEGRTVLFVSHSMAAVKNLCTTGIVMKNGTVLAQGTAKEMVDYYLANYVQFNSSSRVVINSNHRPYPLERIIEIQEVEFFKAYESNQYAIEDDLSISIKVNAKQNIEGFRVGLSIYTIEEVCVGTFFTKSNLDISKNNIKVIQVSLKNHQLAKGQYYISLSVGKGNEITGVKDFDIVLRTLFFEVTYKDREHEEMIGVWDNNWGKINFSNVSVSIK